MPTFYSGAIALIVSWLISLSLTGCRFGNHSEVKTESNSKTTSGDGVTGYYETQARKLSVCVTLASATSGAPDEKNCVETPVEKVPDYVSQVMTNPVILFLDDPTTGKALLAASDGTAKDNQLGIFVNKDKTLEFAGHTTAVPVWADETCTRTLYVTETGKYTLHATPKVADKKTIIGSMDLTIEVMRTFDGDCTASLQSIHACYVDVDYCGGSTAADNQSNQEVVQYLFAFFVETGAMKTEDIRRVRNITYEVLYQ